MERYLNFVERYARAIVFVLVAITAYFTYTLGALMSDTNPYLLKDTHPARKTIIDLQREFTGTYDSVMVALNNPVSVFNTTSLNAQFELSQAIRQLMLANDEDRVELQRIVGLHSDDPDAQGLLVQILAEGFFAERLRCRQSAARPWDCPALGQP